MELKPVGLVTPRLVVRSTMEGLISRLLSGLVVKIDRPDRMMRLELIRRLAAQGQLPPERFGKRSKGSACA